MITYIGLFYLSVLTVTGLVSTSLMYSATVMGPVAFILEVRCRCIEGRDFLSLAEAQQSGLVRAAGHRAVQKILVKYFFPYKIFSA